MVALILLVTGLILPPLDLLGCWIFRLDSLFVGFLFRFLIWFCGYFCLSNMDFGLLVVVFWVVGGCFLGGWWWFFESLLLAGGGFDGCLLNS